MNKSYIPLFTTRSIKRVYAILIPVLLLILLVLHYVFDGFNKIYQYHYNNNSALNFNNKHAGDFTTVSSYFPTIAIYPKNFNNKIPLINQPKNTQIVQYTGSAKSILSNYIREQEYNNHTFDIYSSQETFQECDKIEYKRDVAITNHTQLPDDLLKLTNVLMDQLDNDPAFMDLSLFFGGNLPKIIMKGELRKHFYKFAGTSVWLEQHGVHLMLSRVLFSQKGNKNDPQLSLLYAELFDENWQSLNDIELVLPIVNHKNERVYDSVKFPKFVPIPFYHNSDVVKGRWYGPEDTRFLLTKNQFGDDEPVIIFNSYHRQIKHINDNDDSAVRTKFGFYRSMFVGWLFQYQLGKLNTDGFQDSKFDNVTFNKVKELRIEGKERTSIEKNWTPFVDPEERIIGDDYVYIVYQWNDLKILKCELTDFKDASQSTCQMYYKDIETSQVVGPVRGGTELIPFEENKWIGFLRAHIKDCGCGGSVYRPNFLLLERIDSKFKLTYLSGSITFNIPVYGWKDFETVCAGREANALIPNGIAMYDKGEDYLSLTLSVADQDNVLLHMRGIKSMIESLDFKWDGRRIANKQIQCVVDHAYETCKEYAAYHLKIGDSEAAKKKAQEDERRAKQKEKEEKEKAEKEKADKEKAEKEKAEKEGKDKEENKQ
ncbi:BMT4 Beta-mannosyltransferase 4 [Candida maltosa Xu316]|uniref:Putative WRY family protein 1 n=1 Tax=Candida maltosa (strain Xu316) TaxID=1245528 RepID=M3K4P7_CANMX|nr:putative WRY family protein 1 [Candida maltosa Xu316]